MPVPSSTDSNRFESLLHPLDLQRSLGSVHGSLASEDETGRVIEARSANAPIGPPDRLSLATHGGRSGTVSQALDENSAGMAPAGQRAAVCAVRPLNSLPILRSRCMDCVEACCPGSARRLRCRRRSPPFAKSTRRSTGRTERWRLHTCLD